MRPYSRIARIVYSEHVGVKRQRPRNGAERYALIDPYEPHGSIRHSWPRH